MAIISVFRLEHAKTGCGPFVPHFTDDCIRVNAMAEITAVTKTVNNSPEWLSDERLSSHRLPFFDGMYNIDGKRFATPSIEVLRTWFRETDSYLDALFDVGYTVMEYLVNDDDCVHSSSGLQVAFSNPIEQKDLGFLTLFA